MSKSQFAAVLALVLAGTAQRGGAASRFIGTIVDDANGTKTAARIAITNAHGQFVDIEGAHEHVQYLGKRWCYVDGGFTLNVSELHGGIEIRRGFETRPVWEPLRASGGSRAQQRVFRLQRWINARQQQYLSGDIHAHLPVPKLAHVQMRAEDLSALALLHLANPDYRIAINECFTGRLDLRSTPQAAIYVGQEICDFQMGHVTLPNLTNLVRGYPDLGGGMEYWRWRPHWDLVPAMRAARAQDGLIVWSHMCSLPGSQLPVAIALGLVDAVELVTWNDPTQFPNHWGPWLDSGMSQAEFPVMRSMDLYYQFLNSGFRVPIAAGTDKFAEEIPLGSNRVFARAGKDAGYNGWLAAIKAGKTFVSNGPILEFKVDDSLPGDVVEFKGERQVKARATARSILPFTTLEIVLNGDVVGHKTIPVYSNAPVQGVYSMEVEATCKLTRSAWLVARVVDHPDLKNRILPRELSVFAHTSPVYLLREGSRIREPASIAYLAKYVQGALHWLGTQPKFFKAEDLEAARKEAQEALQVYRKL